MNGLFATALLFLFAWAFLSSADGYIANRLGKKRGRIVGTIAFWAFLAMLFVICWASSEPRLGFARYASEALLEAALLIGAVGAVALAESGQKRRKSIGWIGFVACFGAFLFVRYQLHGVTLGHDARSLFYYFVAPRP
jgi:hypothetical protein